LPVESDDFRTAALFCDQHALGLRAGDALHLAIAARHGAELCTLDRQLAQGKDAMVTGAELRLLEQRGVAIGAHGESHEPLTRVPDPGAELRGARDKLARHLQATPPALLSFPHGRDDAAIVREALASGYELLFTSVPGLNTAHAAPAPLLARVGVETESLSDWSGRYRPDLPALNLFKRPRRTPAAQGPAAQGPPARGAGGPARRKARPPPP